MKRYDFTELDEYIKNNGIDVTANFPDDYYMNEFWKRGYRFTLEHYYREIIVQPQWLEEPNMQYWVERLEMGGIYQVYNYGFCPFWEEYQEKFAFILDWERASSIYYAIVAKIQENPKDVDVEVIKEVQKFYDEFQDYMLTKEELQELKESGVNIDDSHYYNNRVRARPKGDPFVIRAIKAWFNLDNEDMMPVYEWFVGPIITFEILQEEYFNKCRKYSYSEKAIAALEHKMRVLLKSYIGNHTTLKKRKTELADQIMFIIKLYNLDVPIALTRKMKNDLERIELLPEKYEVDDKHDTLEMGIGVFGSIALVGGIIGAIFASK
jgi:hypothetical protein